jgi:hypothetical protein
MMKNSGAVGANPSTVRPALLTLQQNDPRAIADLEMGINPNDDPAALSSDPVPKYGCSVRAGVVDGWAESGSFMAIASLASFVRRRRPRKS